MTITIWCNGGHKTDYNLSSVSVYTKTKLFDNWKCSYTKEGWICTARANKERTIKENGWSEENE